MSIRSNWVRNGNDSNGCRFILVYFLSPCDLLSLLKSPAERLCHHHRGRRRPSLICHHRRVRCTNPPLLLWTSHSWSLQQCTLSNPCARTPSCTAWPGWSRRLRPRRGRCPRLFGQCTGDHQHLPCMGPVHKSYELWLMFGIKVTQYKL